MLCNSVTNALKECLASHSSSPEEVAVKFDQFFAELPSATTEQVATAMQSFASLFNAATLPHSVQAVMLCGCLVEMGHSATPFIHQLEVATLHHLKIAEPFMVAATNAFNEVRDAAADDADIDPYEAVDRIRHQVEKEYPEQIAAFEWLEKIYPCMVSVYCRNKEQWQNGKTLFAEPAAFFAEISTACYWLQLLFTILFDEPVLVIEMEKRIGFLGKMDGIADNFQLQLLLMNVAGLGDVVDTEIEGVVDGSGQQSLERSVEGRWDMCNWGLLSKAHIESNNNDSDQWIWSEGNPSHIDQLLGRRVILLNPPSYKRGLPVQRSFAMLPAAIRIDKWLSSEEIAHWIDKMRSGITTL